MSRGVVEAQGKNYAAKLADIEYRLKRATEEARGDAGKVAAAQEQARASRELLEHQRAVRVDDLNVSAEQHAFRAGGRSEMADYVGVMHRLKRDLGENQGDPEMQRALMRDYAGEMREMLHPDNHAGVYSSAADYASALQTQALDNDSGAFGALSQSAKILEQAGTSLKDASDAIAKVMGGHSNTLGIKVLGYARS